VHRCGDSPECSSPLAAFGRGGRELFSNETYENRLEKNPFGAADFFDARFAAWERLRALGRDFAFGFFAFLDLALRAMSASVIIFNE
jgi:hypothetical protein